MLPCGISITLQSPLGKMLRSFHSLPEQPTASFPVAHVLPPGKKLPLTRCCSRRTPHPRPSSQLPFNIKSSDSWNMSRMNEGALLLGGCVALIGFLRKEITTELIESVCFRGCLAGYTPLLPVATNIRGCRVSPSRYRRQWLGRLYLYSPVGFRFRVTHLPSSWVLNWAQMPILQRDLPPELSAALQRARSVHDTAWNLGPEKLTPNSLRMHTFAGFLYDRL